ncbi:DUF6146 family protein [Flavobacterium sp. NRK F10]|uniref:DUF6146 family protein n=1 Tax=Flavobacterium sp. NRK F10 TaxID=2954931 RepID=UPI0020900493|nr:DUF6146 family protein [Flavobacterium sp. NRK F10]MCO6175705.1 DUF6146 family protein [Flavobacterium sp. NRK F10]
MRHYLYITALVFGLLFSCNSNKEVVAKDQHNDKPKLESDTIRIANDEIEYEIIIIDPGFTSWFNSYAKPRGFYTQSYLEARNIFWVTEWNRRVIMSSQYDPSLYEMQINYNSYTNYGYEVNYMLYNYLVYFQLTNKQRLGGFPPRI